MSNNQNSRTKAACDRCHNLLTDLYTKLKANEELVLSKLIVKHSISTITSKVLLDKGIIKKLSGVNHYAWNTHAPNRLMATAVRKEVAKRCKVLNSNTGKAIKKATPIELENPSQGMTSIPTHHINRPIKEPIKVKKVNKAEPKKPSSFSLKLLWGVLTIEFN